jgi:hypothetical protein
MRGGGHDAISRVALLPTSCPSTMSLASMSTPAILARLTEYRTNTVRKPQEVAQLGQIVIERGWTNSNNDDGEPESPLELCCTYSLFAVWTFLEQIAVAAVECGKLELADVRRELGGLGALSGVCKETWLADAQLVYSGLRNAAVVSLPWITARRRASRDHHGGTWTGRGGEAVL